MLSSIPERCNTFNILFKCVPAVLHAEITLRLRQSFPLAQSHFLAQLL
jgi:hypothetical protein